MKAVDANHATLQKWIQFIDLYKFRVFFCQTAVAFLKRNPQYQLRQEIKRTCLKQKIKMQSRYRFDIYDNFN